MKIFKLPLLSDPLPDRQFCLGPEEPNSNGVYLLYTKLGPGEKDRVLKPEKGPEEIVYVVKGKLNLRQGNRSFTVSEGEAFHLKDDDDFLLDNPSDREAIYIAAGEQSSSHVKNKPLE